MITTTASPSLSTNTLMPVADSAVTANSALISGVTPTEGFSNTLNSQINLLAQPTMDVSALATTIAPTVLAAIANIETQNAASVLPTNKTENAISETVLPQMTTQNPQIAIPAVKNNAFVVSPEIAMSAEDTAILSNVNDTLKFISTGSKLGDTLPAGQTVQLPTANATLTHQSVQSAVQQVVTNTQVSTPAAVLAKQAIPVQAAQTSATQMPVVENPIAQQTVTPAKAQMAVVPQVTTPEKTVVPKTQIAISTETIEQSAVTVQAQIVVSEKEVVTQAVIQTQATIAQQTESTEKPVESKPVTQNQPTSIQQIPAQDVEPFQATQVDAKPAMKNTAQHVAEVAIQAESSLVAETTTLSVVQNIVVKTKVDDSAKSMTSEPEAKKFENSDAPIVTAQQTSSEIVVPFVVAQAVPANTEIPDAMFEIGNQVATPDEKPTLTSAKNLLMEAVANRSNTNGSDAKNSHNGGNPPANSAPQIETSLNPVTDNKAGLTDTKLFTSLLTAEKTDGMGASSTTVATVDKAPSQNISAVVNKLVQDTKMDAPAMTRPLSHPAWHQEMGERIVWMNNQGMSSAEIKMNPPNMGAITVRIDMNQEQATIAFTAQNSEVRTVLENSLPKLREMLTSQNLNLADVNVSQQSSTSTNSDSNRQQQAAQMMADASANGQGGNRQNQPEFDVNGNSIRQINANGEEILVDEFANGNVLETNGSNGLLSIYA